MTCLLLAGGLKKLQPYLLPITIALVCVIVVIAFIIGFARGWRKVSWAGLVWAIASGAYVLIEKTLGKKLDTILSVKLAGKIAEPATHLVPTLISVAIAVVATLLLYSIMNAIFRERYKEVHGDGSHLDMDDEGIVYDEEYEDYDDYERFRDRNSVVRLNGGKPSGWGRVFGALFCIVNVVVFVGVAVCLTLLLLGTTSLKTGALASVYKVKGMSKLMTFCSKYLFDFIIVGLCMAISAKGSQIGGANTLRILIVKIGGVIGGIGAFVIPFTKLAKKGILLKFVTKCVGATGSMGLSATIGGIVGKLLAGFLLCAMVIVAIVILNLLLKGLVNLIDDFGFFRGIDSTISTVVYLALGIVLCLFLFAILAILAKYGIADIGKAFTDNGLAHEMLDTCQTYIDPLFKKIGSLFKGLKK